jgi:hypothetical protein
VTTASSTPAPGIQPPNLYQPSDGISTGQSTADDPATKAQAAAQAAQQQQQQQQANDAAAAEQIAISNLQRVNLRLSDAYENGNSAAVAQLEPIATKLYNGVLQGSAFAGLGNSFPQTFATPEVPPAFLNVAS